jgi:hypothetical protein
MAHLWVYCAATEGANRMNDHTRDTLAQAAWEHENERARIAWENMAVDLFLQRQAGYDDAAEIERMTHPKPLDTDWLRYYLEIGLLTFVQYLKRMARLTKEVNDG